MLWAFVGRPTQASFYTRLWRSRRFAEPSGPSKGHLGARQACSSSLLTGLLGSDGMQ